MNETPVEAARAAGLRYVSDATPGLRRKRSGRRFAYVDATGKTIRDDDVISRIRALAIPPAYEDVWICPDRAAAIFRRPVATRAAASSTAITRAGAKSRDETKYERMVEFGARAAGDSRARGARSALPRYAARESDGGSRAPARNDDDPHRQRRIRARRTNRSD